ncbi:hypothetical protein N7448_000434 [Penicillium atrosanguineum]|uniref:Oxidoreductase n=1 Tax=Penicillium atrosanguineum TaxID=1132637 RepID=A0A9W9HHN4_9EURO|nr:Protein of unknown function DUF1479 [Penicillium atrosanguineum]KAJ5134547.1 hypothetical protein N7526_005912 [Penicillium atrosanguineum]KAJ5148856.1 hypothetical protein N7448_000434 [Penicillium atrosanguineum]KAJ5304171.1 Protein of unknown function DUF1479 [Penicillium atrosanguineum]KAJ5323647.1 hypothetical protein N7476_002247 [Penicillium atrosanguineum]
MSFDYNPNTDIPSLEGRSIFITGGTSGLGAASALHFAKHNAARIYISGRNAKNAESISGQIRDSGSNTEVVFIECDLSSLSSVKGAAERLLSQTPIPELDILMCNAGIMSRPAGLTADGYEVQFGTNHLGHALLIRKLLPLLDRTAREGRDARIIILSSSGYALHPRGGILFDSLESTQEFWIGGPWQRYGQSKLANLLYAREMAGRYPHLTVVAVHPGYVATGLVNNMSWKERLITLALFWWVLIQPHEGSYNQIWAATAPRQTLMNGAYYEPVGRLGVEKLDETARDEDGRLARALWNWTEEALKGL